MDPSTRVSLPRSQLAQNKVPNCLTHAHEVVVGLVCSLATLRRKRRARGGGASRRGGQLGTKPKARVPLAAVSSRLVRLKVP